MTLQFPEARGEAPRWITVPMKTRVQSAGLAHAAAAAELQALTPDEITALYESARDGVSPIPKALTNASTFAAMVEAMQFERYAGAIHCPGCAFLIGRGENVSIAYVTRCSACGGSLSIAIYEHGVVVQYAPKV